MARTQVACLQLVSRLSFVPNLRLAFLLQLFVMQTLQFPRHVAFFHFTALPDPVSYTHLTLPTSDLV